jgi:tripartite-type tricarboxylate transporter receptor subunit TctC
MRLILLFVAMVAVPAVAQHKPLRIVSGAAPGTPGDVVARVIAEPLSAHLGHPVVVENRPGAINTIALAAVAKALPDGLTLGILGMPSIVAPSLIPNMPYDTLRDLTAVRQLSWVSNVLVVTAGSRLADVQQLVQSAKARPGHLTYASGGNGTPAHLAAALFTLRAGIDIRHVPYQGAVAGVTAVIGNQVDMMFAVAPAAVAQIRGGRLRALATPAPARLAVLPEVPTLSELGYAVDVRDWHGVVAPAGTAKPIVTRLEAALEAVLARGEVKERLGGLGLEVANSDAERFRAHISTELAKWARVVKDAGIRAD